MYRKWKRVIGFSGAGAFMFGASLFQFIALNEARTLDLVINAGAVFMGVGALLMLAFKIRL